MKVKRARHVRADSKKVGPSVEHYGTIHLPARSVSLTPEDVRDILSQSFAPGSELTLVPEIKLHRIPKQTFIFLKLNQTQTDLSLVDTVLSLRCSTKRWRVLAHVLYGVHHGDIPLPLPEEDGFVISFMYRKLVASSKPGYQAEDCWAYDLRAVAGQWEITERYRSRALHAEDGCVVPK